jgi:hypothetical protein
MTKLKRKKPTTLTPQARKVAMGMKLGLPRGDAATLARLNSPSRIQDFVNAIPTNFEHHGDTCLSVTEVLRLRHAHCIEAAFVAACALWLQGYPPLMMDFRAEGDDDHVVTLFQKDGCWGAISKSNHVWLRWRDPIYRNLRELALSYFHEYVSRDKKTLCSYSVPFDLRRYDPKIWITGKESCWDIALAIDGIRHYPLITRTQAKNLRRRDPIEVRAGKLLDFTAPNKKAGERY